MSAQSMSSDYGAGGSASGRKRASWLLDRTFWGGVSIVAMWLAVLLVGVAGGDINKVDAGGGTSSVPVVVVVAAAALLATVAVAHSAFGSRRAERELRRAVEDERRDIDRLSAQIDAMRQRPGD